MNWKQVLSVTVLILLAVPWLALNTTHLATGWLAERIYAARWGAHRWANPRKYARPPRREG